MSLVVNGKALGILVEACEGSGLVVGFDSLHFDHLGSTEDVGKLDGGTALFLVFYDFCDTFFDGGALGDSLVVGVSFKRILVSA